MPKRGHTRQAPPVGDPSLPDGLARQAALWFAWMRERNYSEATVEGRVHRLRTFVAWCAERSLYRSVDIQVKHLEWYRHHLHSQRRTRHDKPLSIRAQYLHLMNVRLFFRWLCKQGYIPVDPARDLDLPRLPKRLPRDILTPFEVEQVMAQVNLGAWLGLRDRAILETFYGTGIRRAELLNLRLYDFEWRNAVLFVRKGKGAKDRVVPLGKRTAFWAQQYLFEQRPALVRGSDPGFFFLTYDGARLGRAGVSSLVRKYIGAACIGKSGSCHLLRHSMATAMLEAGADIRYIQQILGHANLQATQVYTQVTITKLKEVYAGSHPGAKEVP